MIKEKLEEYSVVMMQDDEDEVIIGSDKFLVIAAIRNKTQPLAVIEAAAALRAGSLVDGDMINFKGMMFRRI